MTTETETYIETGLQLLDEREESLKALAAEFQGLSVAGIEDKEGFEKLRKARLSLKGERVAIKNAAIDLRATAIRWQKKVIEREKQLIAIIEPIEQELHAEEKRIEQLKEEARQQKEMLEAKQLQDRLDLLSQYDFAADWVEVKHMTDDQFNEMLAHAKDLHEAELKRQAEQRAEEERKRKEEEERMQREREELARQRAEQEARERELQRQEQERIEAERKRQEEIRAEREKLEAERRAIEEEKRKHEEALRIEQAKKEAAERARMEEQERIKREAEEKAERERLAKLEAERQEALKPDKEKLLGLAERLDAIAMPEVSSQQAKGLVTVTAAQLTKLIQHLVTETSRL